MCEYPDPPAQRSLTPHFSDPVGTVANCFLDDGHGHQLDVCGENTVVDARLIADTLFKSSAVETPVTIHFDLYPNFVNHTAFMLTFVDPVPVSAEGTARTLSTANAVAELKVRKTTGKKSTFVSVGQYYMSLSMTVTT